MTILKRLFNRRKPASQNTVSVFERQRFSKTMPGEMAARTASRFGMFN